MSDIPALYQALVAIVACLAGFVYSAWLRIRRGHLEDRYRDEQRKIEYHRIDQVMREGLFAPWREVDNREEYIKKRMENDKVN